MLSRKPEPCNPVTRFAVVGLGHIGSRHASILASRPDTQMVALIDNREGFQDEDLPWLGVSRFQNLEDFLNSEVKADVLCVCTPNYLHHPHTLAGLRSGLHVVCEKPMALHTDHALEMIAVAEHHDRHIFCVMQNRYSPPAMWLKEVLEAGLLGRIYHVQVNCFWNRDARYYTPGGWRGSLHMDGGALFTQFSHYVDMLYWLFGDFTNITGQFRNFSHQHLTDFEDSGFLQFDFKRGGMGSFNFSTSAYDRNLTSSITILAENGSIQVGGQYMEQVVYCHLKDYTMPALPPCEPANDYGPYQGSAANHQHVFDNVMSTLTAIAAPTATAHDGLQVVDLIRRMYACGSHARADEMQTGHYLEA